MAALFTKALLINQGATLRESWVWSAGDPAIPVNLIGCTARMQIRLNNKATTVMANLTTENGGIILGGATGSVTLLINAVATDKFSWETGVYDVEVAFPDGIVTRLTEGTVTVSSGVTR